MGRLAPWPLAPAPRAVRVHLLGGFDLRIEGRAVPLPCSAQRLVGSFRVQLQL